MKREKLKIAFVLDDSLDKTDGVQQYVMTLGKWLGSRGHDVHYLVGETRLSNLENIHSLSKNIQVSFNGNRMSIPILSSSSKIKRLLDREQFDLIHIQVPYSPFLGGRILRLTPDSTAIVGTFHIIPYGRLQYLASRFLAVWQRNSLQRIDEMLSVSPAAQNFAENGFRVRSQVLSNAVDLSGFRDLTLDVQRANTFNIVFLGRHVKRKGCMQLLEAFNGLKTRPDFKDIKLTIAGRGPLTERMKNYARIHRINTNVNFAGYLSESGKKSLLAHADIAVFPSSGGESFGIVLIEAMAAGAGVVMGGDNEGYRSVLGKWQECLFDPGDTKGFTASLVRLIDDPDLLTRLHTDQQKAVQEYSIDYVGPKVANLYKSVIAKYKITADNIKYESTKSESNG